MEELTGQAAPEAKDPIVPQAEPPETPEGGAPPQTPAVDWEARAKEVEANLALREKEINDLRSMQFSNLSREEMVTLLKDFHQRQEILADTMLKGGSMEEYQASIKETQRQQESSQEFAADSGAVAAYLNEQIEDMGIEMNDPRISRVVQLFTKSQTEASAAALRQAEREFNRLAPGIRKEQAKKSSEQLEAEHKKALEDVEKRTREAALKEAGVFDNGSGTDIGRGAGVSWAQAQKIKNMSDLSDDAYEKLIANG